MNAYRLSLAGLLLLFLACSSERSRPSDTTTDVAAAEEVAQPLDVVVAQDVVAVPDVAMDASSPLDLLDEDGSAGDVAEPEFGLLFSFAVLADPHVDGNPAHLFYLERAVDLLISENEDRDIELVFVVGDIAWGETDGQRHIEQAREMLERLEDAGMHYVPVMGDNEVQYADDREFDEVFGPQYEYLAGLLENWRQMPGPVEGALLQSFSFEHRGCHFVSPDFISRDQGDEAATLHDYPGGTWPWFLADIEAAAVGPAERISVLTHHGMFRTGFDSVDRLLLSEAHMTQIEEALCPFREHIAQSYGGHIHQNWYWDVTCPTGERIYEVWSTDDTRDAVVAPEADDYRITARIVDVISTPEGFTYEQHLIETSTRDE